MADIELVIKISEKVYNALTHTEFDANLVVNEMKKSIANGTPLPKGHSDLIDRDELLDTVPELNAFEEEEFDTEWMVKLVHAASPIIKADKE